MNVTLRRDKTRPIHFRAALISDGRPANGPNTGRTSNVRTTRCPPTSMVGSACEIAR